MGRASDLPEIYFDGSRQEMAQFIPEKVQRVLEIGCGEGGFRKNLPADVEYWGVEPEGSAAAVSGKIMHKVINSLYDQAESELPNDYFDLVVCNDVIEHMIDHDAFFELIKCKLRKGGCVLGSVPNVRHYSNLIELLLGRDWQYQSSGILDKTHLRFFTEKSLRACLLSHSYNIEVLTGINGKKKRFMPPKRLFREMLISIMGQDIRYVQLAFRVSV